MEEFEKKLTELINEHSIENDVDMPDFILAGMICRMIKAMGPSIKQALDWHGCDSICHPSPNTRGQQPAQGGSAGAPSLGANARHQQTKGLLYYGGHPMTQITDDQILRLWQGYDGTLDWEQAHMQRGKLLRFLRGLINRGPDLFHAHLDLCEQCRNHPMQLCPDGDLALKLATMV